MSAKIVSGAAGSVLSGSLLLGHWPTSSKLNTLKIWCFSCYSIMVLIGTRLGVSYAKLRSQDVMDPYCFVV